MLSGCTTIIEEWPEDETLPLALDGFFGKHKRLPSVAFWTAAVYRSPNLESFPEACET